MGLSLGLQTGFPFTIKCNCCDKKLRIRPFRLNGNGNEMDSFPPNIRLYFDGDKEMRVTLHKNNKNEEDNER